ncbi:clostripain-related cysteine peptidase [Aquabacterium humicola]|uniref:clostripain-related cysteine peptidase n=1 Tax=Aquabacterium humicola TaxID=3237377 RepID=UPI002542B36D|nr:clostripain-related cysteine peptidase [Rubrivivax pictus]
MPNLIFSTPLVAGPPGAAPVGVTLALYAPFGTDAVLSTYPGGSVLPIQQHALVQHLLKVSECGVHVSALIDLHDDDSYLVDIPANKPLSMQIASRWKQDMQSPRTLAGFLRRARQLHPETALVLALEGHGAGFLPEIDRSQLSTEQLTQGGEVAWQLGSEHGEPVLPMGSPLLPMGSPLLPMGSPLLPVNHMPLSTWGLATALKDALGGGAGSGRKLAAIHFNNCFNMAVEVLHTVAPYADYATGYMNYNFFTGGETYPAVFNKLKIAGNATTQQLSQWLAEANRDLLATKTHHPTTGAAVQLSRMPLIAARVDALAQALVAALTGAPAAERPTVVGRIRTAIIRAQQYDTGTNARLDVPDELTDLRSLAEQLMAFAGSAAVVAAATQLHQALATIKVYGASATPWIAPDIVWDFSSRQLAMNILCPDPVLRGLWDWRSPFYLQKAPTPAQPQVIDFLKSTAWVDFIIEYHKQAKFVGLLPAAIPGYPIFDRKLTLP